MDGNLDEIIARLTAETTFLRTYTITLHASYDALLERQFPDIYPAFQQVFYSALEKQIQQQMEAQPEIASHLSEMLKKNLDTKP